MASARFYDRTGQPEQAIALYQRARSLAPQNGVVCNDLGLCQARRRDFPQALSALEQAVALDPQNPRYRNNLATVLVEVGRPDDAVTALRPMYPAAMAYHNVGYLLHSRRQFDAAERYFAEAARQDPGLAPAQIMLAQVRARLASTPLTSADSTADQPTTPTVLPATKPEAETSGRPTSGRAWEPTRTTARSPDSGPIAETASLRKLPPAF